MIYLLAKMDFNIPGLQKAFLGYVDEKDPASVLENGQDLHTYWVLSFPLSSQVVHCVLDSGVGRVNIVDKRMIVSGNTKEWHEMVRELLKDGEHHVRMFGTVLIQTFPQIFKTFSTRLNSDGTLSIR